MFEKLSNRVCTFQFLCTFVFYQLFDGFRLSNRTSKTMRILTLYQANFDEVQFFKTYT